MFGDVVRNHRRRLGLTQEELAERAGVNVRTIGKIEADRIAIPRPATVRLLADAFGLTGEERDRFCAGAASPVAPPAASTVDIEQPVSPPLSGSVPRQAPASLADFTGRQKELHLIETLLTEEPAHAGAAPVVSVSGMAGVGKTTLAVRVAHDLARRFPGGCLFADLRGADSVPTPALHVLGAFLRACGVRDTLPSTVDERAALYRTVLSGRRMLVVLDNAAGEDQVRPLLPGAGSAALVTSRRSLAGLSGAHLVHLETFPATDSMDLLAAVAGRDRVGIELDAAQRVVQLCGGLPLALRVAAVRLVQHDNLRMGALSARLADERERLDELAIADVDVRASLAISYQQLTPEHSLLLDALCALPLVDIPSWLVARMLEVSRTRARRQLEELSAAQLLLAMAPDRYQIHDLIRVFGRERGSPETGRLTRRACVAIRDRARAMNAALPCRPIPVPHGSFLHSGSPDGYAVEFFAAELGNVTSAVGFALASGDATLAAQLAGTVVNICLMRGYVDEWEHCHQLVLAHASRLEPGPLGMLELGMGTLRRFQDRNREALPHLRRAFRLLRDDGDNLGATTALLSWGIAARTLGRLGFAWQANASALALLRETNDKSNEVDINTANYRDIVRGYALLAQHHLDRELDSLTQALSVFETEGEHWGAAEAHSLLARRLSRQGDPYGAEPHVRLAMDIYAQLGDHVNLTMCELSLARIHLALTQYDKAARLLRRALNRAEELHHPWSQASAHRLLGQLLLEQADPQGAQPHLRRSVALMRDARQPMPQASALELLAQAHAALGETDQALRAGYEALDLLTMLNPQAGSALAAWLATIEP